MDNTVYKAIKKTGIEIKKAAEIGVLSFQESALKHFAMDGIACDLYEAVPAFCDEIKRDISKFKNVTLYDTAVADYHGTMDLAMAGASTFNATQKTSPAINHDKYNKSQEKMIRVPCIDFADQDPGDYDLVCIDIEGGESQVICRMISRPKVISVETQSRDYVNPHLGSITDWMVVNGYRTWIWNDTDTVFIQGIYPFLGLFEWIKAKWHNFRYFANRL